MRSTQTMTREEWLAERRGGIGGSDIAAILGVSPHRSALAVYADKLGLTPEAEATEAMRQGVDLEQYVARRFSEATGLATRRRNAILRHPEYGWMLANVDRLVVGRRAGLECKTAGAHSRAQFEGGAPAACYWQCQWYMAVTGYPVWYLAVLVHGVAFHTFEIGRNDEDIARMIDRARAFWFDSVQARVPPPPSGSDRDGELVALLPASRGPGEVADLEALDGDIALMEALKAEADGLNRRAKAIKQRVLLHLGGAEAGRSSRWEVTCRDQPAERLDLKRLKAERPDVFDAYLKPVAARVVRVRPLNARPGAFPTAGGMDDGVD